jgi:hypothetical protein
VRLVQAGPEELWDAANHEFLTSGLTEFAAFIRFHVEAANPGQFVIACGFHKSGGPWVCVDDESGLLYLTAVGGDYRHLAELGKSRCIKKDKMTSHNLMARIGGNQSYAIRFAAAKVRWSYEQKDSELGVSIDLEVKKNAMPMMPYRIWSSRS